MNYQMKFPLEANKTKSLFPRLILFFAALFLYTVSFAQAIPERPSPPRLVNDFAGILSAQGQNSLEQKLVRFNDTTSNQIAVVLVESLQGYDPNMFAYELGESWKVGQGEFNNGIVVLVKPKTPREKGQAAIATGYGLEGAIPDAIAKRIVENEMIPAFRQNDYYRGIDNATNVLMELAAGEISSDQYKKQTQGSPLTALIPFIIIAVVFILIRSSSRKNYTMSGRRSSGSGLWTALILGSMLGGGGHRSGGGWGNFSSGSGNFGGGGGFGGFGGGSFGGGGASGSW